MNRPTTNGGAITKRLRISYKQRAIVLMLPAWVARCLPIEHAHAARQELRNLRVNVNHPSKEETIKYAKEFRELRDAKVRADVAKIAGVLGGQFGIGIVLWGWSLEAVRDPSIAYRAEFGNPFTEPKPIIFDVSFPINSLSSNTVWGQFDVELIDANDDDVVFLDGNFGPNRAIQNVTVRDTVGGGFVNVGPDLGTSITGAGVHTFTFETISGPTLDGGDELSLLSNFILSPGDSVRITSRFIIDEETGIPFAEIPDLPDPADGPYLNVIEVDTPETSVGDDAFVGSQTQLNLSDGGVIGERFNFQAFMNNQLNDNNFDMEINVTGGTVGNQFMALGGTTVNVSGGTFNGIFLAGSYLGQSTDVVVNISGGSVAAGIGGDLQVYAGSLVNISGGTVGGFSGHGGVISLSGGTLGQGELQGNISVNSGSVMNISGGQFNDESSDPAFINVYGNSVANISGGLLITDERILFARDGSAVNLFGTEFLIDGEELTELVYGEPLEITDRNVTLSGLLADGSPFVIDFNPDDPFPNQADWVHPGALLTVTLGIPGDYNNDGVVNAADYVVWRNNEGTDAVLPNDTSQGSVTQLDYDVWVENFGRTWPGSGSAAAGAVPEPATWLLLTWVSFLLHAGRQKLEPT